MDLREYIESGKLESYVLGICTSEEAQEAECMARIFPEVGKELESIRTSFEKYALANKVEPPVSVKSKILDAIGKEDASSVKTETKIISIDGGAKTVVKPTAKYLVAASITVILISVFSAFMLSQRKNELTAQLNELRNEQKIANAKYDELNGRFNKMNKQVLVMVNPDAAHVTMKGTPVSPQSIATIYWNKQSKEVYIAVSSLPQPPTGKQYQLWGIVNGVPVDLGVFDVPAQDDSSLQKMKAVDGASTFAVTLEAAGGSPNPTLDQMYVAGNI